MCAKPAKKSGPKSVPPASPAAPVAAPVASPAPPESGAAGEATVAWIDSADPRRRLVGKIALAGVWVYVAALWLLALDQTFHWGIFGPKVPPMP